MKRFTWVDIAGDVDAVLDICRQLGLQDIVKRSRFTDYLQRLHTLTEVLNVRGQEGASDIFNRDPMANGVALGECAELATLLPFIREMDSEVIRPKLERMLLGPILPSEEEQNSSIGRNTLFELNIAARLYAAKVDLMLGERPDLACEVEGRRLLIECKRPTSLGAARKAIGRARDQIVRDLKKSPAGSRGVIAISLSKIINPGDKLYVYRGEAAGRQGLAAVLDAQRQALQDSCRALPDKIMGMLWHVVTVARDDAIPLGILAQDLTVEGFIRRSPDDDHELRVLYERIAPLFY